MNVSENELPSTGQVLSSSQSMRPSPRAILILAAAWGLLVGFVEGAALLLFGRLGWLNFTMALFGASVEILWVSPVFSLLLFGLMGAVFALLVRWKPEWTVIQGAVFLLAFFGFYDWVALSGRIRVLGCVMLALGLATVTTRAFRQSPERVLRWARLGLPWLATAALLATAVIEGGLRWEEGRAVARLPEARPGSPNILVIVVDTLRADHLSAYGYKRQTSPNLDRLAEQGVLFESAFATSSWTLPSHASLVTGRYPHEHAAEEEPLDNRYPTIAEALRERGYRTAAFSANHMWFSRSRGFGRGFLRFEDYFNTPQDMVLRTFWGRKLTRSILFPLGLNNLLVLKPASAVTDSTLRWIRQNPEKPYFAFLNYLDVHDPYLPPQPFRGRFSNGKDVGGILNEFQRPTPPDLTPEQLQSEIDAYDGAIAYVDYQIGRLLEGLKEQGLLDNTIVVVTSDHGEAFGENGLLLHRNALYRSVVHVPLIIRWPGHVPGGTRLAVPVTNASLPATFMEFLGEPRQDKFPIPSLAILWKDSDGQRDWPDVLVELAKMPYIQKFPAYHGWMKGLVHQQWHYIVHETLGEELYDWRNDPREDHNLVQTPEGQATREMAERLERMLGYRPQVRWQEQR
jgi:arylsulfatase A-like enzyme